MASALNHASSVNMAGTAPKSGTTARPPMPSNMTAWSGPGARHTGEPVTDPPSLDARRPEIVPLAGV